MPPAVVHKGLMIGTEASRKCGSTVAPKNAELPRSCAAVGARAGAVGSACSKQSKPHRGARAGGGDGRGQAHILQAHGARVTSLVLAQVQALQIFGVSHNRD